MNLFEYIKLKILKRTGIKRLPTTPNNNRLTFISDDEAIRVENIRAYKVWYYGDSSELLNYYTNQQAYGWLSNPIYNRNKVNMFWGKSSEECNIKRIHCGIPKAIIDTLCNVVGKPDIQTNDLKLERPIEKNDFMYKLVNQIRPMTLVEGDCCIKLNVNPELTNFPLIEYYGAEDWEPICKSGILLGVIFKTYYKDKKNRNYVLMETRSLKDNNCIIEYALYRLGQQNELEPVGFDAIDILKGLPTEPQVWPVRNLFAYPLKYYYNPLRPERGKSLFDGAVDMFDMLDEIWSQASQTNRVSTPVEYYNVDLLQRTKDGLPILPKMYNRQYVADNGTPDADGMSGSDGIKTTQPDLNFDKYSMLANDVLNYILIGRLSPSSLGIDVAKKDNADAQREKEKQTIFTRNNIIERETVFLKDICEGLSILQNYIDTGLLKEAKVEVSIKYDEFANPSFESELGLLGPAWNNGQISTERYVNLLWAGKLSPEEMEKEIAWLDDNKQSDNIDLESLMGNNNETRTNENISTEGQEQEEIIATQE